MRTWPPSVGLLLLLFFAFETNSAGAKKLKRSRRFYAKLNMTPECLQFINGSCENRGLASHDALASGFVRMACLGDFGNNLHQFIFARLIAERLNFALDVCQKIHALIYTEYQLTLGLVFPNLRGISRIQPTKTVKQTLPTERLGGHFSDLLNVTSNTAPRVIQVAGYPFSNYAFYQEYKDYIRGHLLVVNTSCVPWYQHTPQDDDVVIHLRSYNKCGHVAKTNPVHNPKGNRKFADTPVAYYENALENMRLRQDVKNIWLVSRCGMNDTVAILLQQKYGAKLSPHAQKPLQEFLFMQRAQRLIIPASTFGWWAAYLSSAREIHYPLFDSRWFGKKASFCLHPREDHYYYHTATDAGHTPSSHQKIRILAQGRGDKCTW